MARFSADFVACLRRFRPLGSPFGVAKLRKHAESLREHGENLPAALCLPRRTPTRVRRSREASSIRRTRRLRRERSVLNNASYSRILAELGELASPYPSTGLRESADPPPPGESLGGLVNFFLLKSPKFALLAHSWALFVGFNTALGRSWLGFARFLCKKSLQETSEERF